MFSQPYIQYPVRAPAYVRSCLFLCHFLSDHVSNGQGKFRPYSIEKWERCACLTKGPYPSLEKFTETPDLQLHHYCVTKLRLDNSKPQLISSFDLEISQDSCVVCFPSNSFHKKLSESRSKVTQMGIISKHRNEKKFQLLCTLPYLFVTKGILTLMFTGHT